MSESDETAGLRAEVETLRAEVAHLRAWQAAHVCAPPVAAPGTPASWPCTCGSTAGCVAHPWSFRPNAWANACAGNPASTIVINSGEKMYFTREVTPGAAAQPVGFTYTVTI